MSWTEGRPKKIAADNPEPDHEPDISAQLSDARVSSVEAVAFYKPVAEECPRFKTLHDLVAHIDARGRSPGRTLTRRIRFGRTC